MIRYNLICASNHEFEGWFSSSADYDAQADQGLLICPACGSPKVEKAIMAPAVKTARKSEVRAEKAVKAMTAMAAKIRDGIGKNCENLGERRWRNYWRQMVMPSRFGCGRRSRLILSIILAKMRDIYRTLLCMTG